MKAKFFSFLFLLTVVNCFSQSTEALKKSTQELYKANFLMDFEGIEKLSYPKMVENIGHDTFLEKTEQHYENEAYRLRYQLENMPIPSGTIKKISNQSFCVINVRIPKRYFFEKKLTTEEAAEKKLWLQEINKTKEVTFEPNRNSFNVKKTTTYLAIYDESTNGQWKFINFDNPEQVLYFEANFEEAIKKELQL